MKHTFIIFACLGLMMSLTACGNDDPEIPRDRDVTMTIEALVHTLNADGEASISVGDKNEFVFHPKTLTADMKLSVGNQTFNIQQLPVKAVEYTYHYTFNSPTTSNADITNLSGIFDIADPLAVMQCDMGDKHLCITIPDIFFEKNTVNFGYSDNSTSRDGNSYWIFSVDKTGKKADVIINNVEIAKDIMIKDGTRTRTGRYFSAIIGNGANVTPTATGITISAETLSTKASYGNGQEVADAYKTEDYPINNLNINVNLTTGTYQASMVIRHILARDESKNPTEWDDIIVTASGIIFKQSGLNL